MWMACPCEGYRLDRKRRGPSCHLLPMWQGVGRVTSTLSAEQRASRRPALLEMSFRSSIGKSKQRQGKKRRLSRRDRSVWAPASSLLVILHYLLKNNITFMWGITQRSLSPAPRCALSHSRCITGDTHRGDRA